MWGKSWFDRNAYTNNVLTRNFVLSFFLIEGFHLWFSFIACPQHLLMIDIEDHCWLLCQIFVGTHMCCWEQESPLAGEKAPSSPLPFGT